ncbi:MAG: DUF1440 domain-containing protein [Methylobacterium mesophilicum]|nr:DUF1440 domain-containing protein [Methylobacterium mesophilicum]
MPRDADLAKGVVAGLAAGLVASLAMDLFQRVAHRLQSSEEASDDDPATVKAANAVARQFTGRPVPRFAKPAAGEAVHDATGTGLGALYGALAELAPVATSGTGAGYAVATWAAFDGGAVPMLGWGPKPAETPPSSHAYGLASHLVYGVTLELARKPIRARLRAEANAAKL